MKFAHKSKQIFTPQGKLEDVEKDPNLDFLMNIFNIPRAFGVSGFGQPWNVGQHSYAVSLIALLWARFNRFDKEKRDRFVVQALLHDIHEAVTGDILPMLKSDDVRQVLDRIQGNILKTLDVEEDPGLKVDLKIIDIIAFIYEIQQVSPSIMHKKKLTLAHEMANQQREVLFAYAQQKGVPKEKLLKFFKKIDL